MHVSALVIMLKWSIKLEERENGREREASRRKATTRKKRRRNRGGEEIEGERVLVK